MIIYANGPAGTADTMWTRTVNDEGSTGTIHSNGFGMPAGTDTQIVGTTAGGNYSRVGETAMLKTGSTLVQVDFNAVADDRSSGSCFIYGTATRAT